jgi:carnitine O-acetyltransferase
LRAAAAKHVQRAKEYQAGSAPEQHLWELQLLQRGAATGMSEASALFDSPGWLTMRDDYLSTSSAPSTNVQYGGFGPTSSHCIGIGYMLLADRFSAHLSTPRTAADEMHVFKVKLREAISELKALLWPQ